MKRYIRTSTDNATPQYILDAVESLVEPEPYDFKGSKVSAKGLYKDMLTFRVSNHGGHGYHPQLQISSGGAYDGYPKDSFEEAKQELIRLYGKYVAYKMRFKGRDLSKQEYADLTNGL